MIAGSAGYREQNHIRLQYQLMLIIAVLLAVYYPVVFGDLSFVDDQEIIEAIRNSEPLNLRDLFIPHMKAGVYYRPILFLSFYADKYLFNLDPGFMHLHNIMLHVVNALLVFWLTRQLAQNDKEGKNVIPLLSALFFGLHPIATEPVCWIAGRTDVLACTFILLSANCIIRFKKIHSYWYAALSAIFMSLGFLTKEVALAFLPGAFLLMRSQACHECGTVPQQKSASQSSQDRHLYLFFLYGVGAVLFFFLLRHFAFETNEGRIGSTIRFMQRDTIHIALIFLRALGFYIKKIFLPFPLNFTIRDVDSLYELLAVPLVVVCFFLISKRNQLSALFMTGIFLIIPSFPIALGQIAWTFYAERYLYLPTAFIMVASVIFISGLLNKRRISSESGVFKLDSRFHGNDGIVMKVKKRWTHYAKRKEIFIMLLLAIMAVATLHRSMVWKDNLTFLRDAVTENPQFYYVRGQYARALALRNDIKNARIQFTAANEYNANKKRLKFGNELFQLRYWDLPEMGLAYLLVRENRIPEAIAAYEKIIRESRGESVGALNNVIILYGGMLNDTKSRPVSDRIKKKISFYTEKLYNTSDNADTFYWLGKIFLMRGERQEALAYFKKAESKFNPDNEYKVIAQKFIARLENK